MSGISPRTLSAAARGEKLVHEGPYTQDEIDAVEALRFSADGRVNRAVDKLHSQMLMHNAWLSVEKPAAPAAAEVAPTIQESETGQAPENTGNVIE